MAHLHFLRRLVVRIGVVFVLSTLAGAASGQAQSGPTPEINTILMQSTYRISGPKLGDITGNEITVATSFLMGKPTPDGKGAYYVLITAKHVLDEIRGDAAILAIRRQQSDGSYKLDPWPIAIRKGGQPLYVTVQGADVTALYIKMPNDLNIGVLPTTLLADDNMLRHYEIHPGDELLCLGFPLGISSDSGFPILRSGKIASYPIVPTSVFKTISYDFRIYEGNSGGPVYFYSSTPRIYSGSMNLGQSIQFVVGLISQKLSAASNNEDLQLATVVPAAYILEALTLLPATPPTNN
jgi:hypothetical protein